MVRIAPQNLHRASIVPAIIRPLTGRLTNASAFQSNVALVCLTPIVSAIPFVPGILLLMHLAHWRKFWIYLSLLPSVGASFVFLLTTQVAILKWILVGKVKPGIYPSYTEDSISEMDRWYSVRISLDHVGQ